MANKVQNPITNSGNGLKTWISQTGDKYLVTGKDRSGKRFRIETSSWPYANSLNVWNGNKYLLRDGKRFLIQKISN